MEDGSPDARAFVGSNPVRLIDGTIARLLSPYHPEAC
jgi:hypothetical protein